MIDAVRALSTNLQLDARTRPFDIHRFGHERSAQLPTLHLDDVSAIPFLTGIAGVAEYQHRARVRATSGDLFASVTASAEGYEAYCQAIGLGSPTHVHAEPVGHPLEVALACGDGIASDTIARRAEAAGGLIIHPYMGTESVWSLARSLAERARVPVSVLAPSPPVTWLANDKVQFGRLVRAVLGSEFVTEQQVVATHEAAAAAALELSKKHRRIGLKRPRCASAMGNLVLESASIATAEDAMAAAVKFADSTSWPAGEAALVTAWLDASSSPSTQTWIPPIGTPPTVDGVYEQLLAGETKVFVGSRPSTLPDTLNRRLADAALKVAGALQELGYVGRCSFDHIVVGDPADEPRIIFTECNGRWGGTSTPMHLVDRLIDGPRPSYRAQDVVSDALVGIPLPEILAALGGELYGRSRTGRLIVYNVGPLAASGKLDVIALGATPSEADDVMDEVLPSLLKI